MPVLLLLLATGFTTPGNASFPWGVAAGDVTDASAVLWTRTSSDGTVRWEVALDDRFRSIVRADEVAADADRDLTVCVDVDGLEAGRTYYYRFLRVDAPDAVSATGTFRTAPPTDALSPLRFAISGDSDASEAPFFVLDFAAREGLDLFLYIGDTIYGDIPASDLGVATTLDEYRAKYRQNRADPYLQRLLAATAVWVAWDDHEVTDNYGAAAMRAAGRGEQVDAAYRAFIEYMPVRRGDDPFRLYRSFRYGRTAEFFLLDGRQYRDPGASDACGGQADPFGLMLGGLVVDAACVQHLSERRTLLGPEQLEWLKAGLVQSAARVKFVVTDVPIEFVGVYPYDRWDGYDAERRELFEFIDANRIENVWFLTTDFHANAYNPDVMAYFRERRPDYALSNGVVCPEIITGPIATATLHDELVKIVAPWLGLEPDSFAADLATRVIVQPLLARLVQWNDLRFVETDRFSYAVVEVDATGAVRTRFQGLRSNEPDGPAELVTLHEEPRPALPLPCGWPLIAAVGLCWWAAAAWNHRVALNAVRQRNGGRRNDARPDV